MLSFDLSFFSVLSWLLPQSFLEVMLLSIVVLLSVIAQRMLSISAWLPKYLCDVLSDMSKTLSFCAEKLAYIDRRLDAAQSTFSDTVRHVAERIAEFDPQIGEPAVLSRWLRSERDQFELRRQSMTEWVLVSATAQLTVLNELIYERISEPGDETEAKISRVVGTLRRLSHSAQMGWAKLSGGDPELLDVQTLIESSAQRPSQLIIEYWQEVLSHHKDGLAEMAKQWEADISKAMSGLTPSEVFHA
jgi:hypothetical protein